MRVITVDAIHYRTGNHHISYFEVKLINLNKKIIKRFKLKPKTLKLKSSKFKVQVQSSKPFSIFLLFLLLHILTVQTDNIMAATKNSTEPTTPAVIARGPFIDSPGP